MRYASASHLTAPQKRMREMPGLLGKRKRVAKSAGLERPEQSRDSSDDDSARALFQRAFEAKFRPLEQKPITTQPFLEHSPDDEQSSDAEQDSEWSGFDDDNGSADNIVEIVEHVNRTTSAIDDIMSKTKRKSFMSSKPPNLVEEMTIMKAPDNAKSAAVDGEMDDLKNDLALQRLLKESHLLDQSSFQRGTAVPQGRQRLRALDMRVQDLGAKSSILEQENMPLSHRRGITTKALQRETARRQHAAENGIVLERPGATVKKHRSRKQGISGPSIGKFRGGTLNISARDVKSIEGSRQGPDRRRRHR